MFTFLGAIAQCKFHAKLNAFRENANILCKIYANYSCATEYSSRTYTWKS